MKQASQTRRDYYAGALMVLIGLAAASMGTTYGIGSLTDMQSGFFPLALGVILVLLGLVIAGTATGVRKLAAPDKSATAAPEWRGWIAIIAGIIAFVVLGRWGGFLPATFAITFISALGDRDNGWRGALGLATAISIIGVVVFRWALEVQLPLFGWG